MDIDQLIQQEINIPSSYGGYLPLKLDLSSFISKVKNKFKITHSDRCLLTEEILDSVVYDDLYPSE